MWVYFIFFLGIIYNLFYKKCFVLLKGGCGNNCFFIWNKIKFLYKSFIFKYIKFYIIYCIFFF